MYLRISTWLLTSIVWVITSVGFVTMWATGYGFFTPLTSVLIMLTLLVGNTLVLVYMLISPPPSVGNRMERLLGDIMTMGLASTLVIDGVFTDVYLVYMFYVVNNTPHSTMGITRVVHSLPASVTLPAVLFIILVITSIVYLLLLLTSPVEPPHE